ncbi:hypothetical protein J6590_015519 [Homalodisca vitripennis]|nr:hypothetical protein J6590_015519 [Homalodisca vitripennis]
MLRTGRRRDRDELRSNILTPKSKQFLGHKEIYTSSLYLVFMKSYRTDGQADGETETNCVPWTQGNLYIKSLSRLYEELSHRRTGRRRDRDELRSNILTPKPKQFLGRKEIYTSSLYRFSMKSYRTDGRMTTRFLLGP